MSSCHIFHSLLFSGTQDFCEFVVFNGKNPNNLHWKVAEEQQIEYVLCNIIEVKLVQTMSYILLFSVIYLFSYLSRGFADLWVYGELWEIAQWTSPFLSLSMNAISFIRVMVSLGNSNQQSSVLSEMSSFEDLAEIFKYSECLHKIYLWDWVQIEKCHLNSSIDCVHLLLKIKWMCDLVVQGHPLENAFLNSEFIWFGLKSTLLEVKRIYLKWA